jgi:Skp family chaperone for outer membrane proteins
MLICICILSLSTSAFAADEVKPVVVDKPKVAEKSEAVIKLGAVDLPQVAEKSEAGARAMATLKEMYDKFQAKMKTKEKELEKLKAALQGMNPADSKREAKEKQFQKKFGEYQQFGKKAQQEFAQKQAELSKQIKDDLDRLIKDYGRGHGYALIVNKEGLVYGDSKYEVADLTEEILKLVNTAGKK